jgi:hypothetical protein
MRPLSLLICAALAIILPVSPALADTVYNVSLSFSEAGEGSATINGTITTDGTVGPLSSTDIVSWNLAVTEAGSLPPYATNSLTFTPSDSAATISGSSLVASASELDAESTGDTLEFKDGSLDIELLWNGDVAHIIGPGNTIQSVALSLGPGGNVFATAVTPEPGSLVLLATGLAGLGTLLARRRRGLRQIL